ncbi:MAG: ABC transporter substrate-binding protein [Chloroflexi bacterium]|nr:ABC transporter substrate-binding protein [Chloroflexota bacterium]
MNHVRCALAILLFVLTACSTQPAATQPRPTQPVAAQPAAQAPPGPTTVAPADSQRTNAPASGPVIPSGERELVAAIRGGSIEETFVKSVFPGFEKKYNVKVIHTVDTSVAALAKIQAQRNNPQTDVIINTDQSHPQAKTAGLIEKLDPAKVSNLKNLTSIALDPDGVGAVFGINTFAIEYNTQIYGEKGIAPPTSWNDLFDPKVRGHMAINGIDNVYGMMALVAIARANGADERNVEPAFAKLKALGKDLVIAKAPANLDEFLQQKEVWVTSNGQSRFFPLKEKGFSVAWVDPKEGPLLQLTYFDVIKGAPHPNLAHAFMEYVLSEEIQLILAEQQGWGPTNKNVKLPSTLAQKVPSIDIAEKSYRPDWTYINSVVDRWIDRANRELGK